VNSKVQNFSGFWKIFKIQGVTSCLDGNNIDDIHKVKHVTNETMNGKSLQRRDQCNETGHSKATAIALRMSPAIVQSMTYAHHRQWVHK
jgi:hypothetical protein